MVVDAPRAFTPAGALALRLPKTERIS